MVMCAVKARPLWRSDRSECFRFIVRSTRSKCGEDVELGIRLHQAGCQFKLLEGMEAVHFPHQKDSDSKQKTSFDNIDYTDKKHNLSATRFMKDYNWEQLMTHFQQPSLQQV